MYKVCLRRVSTNTYAKEYLATELPSSQTHREARKKGFILDVFASPKTPLSQTFAEKQTRAKFDRNAALYPVGPKNLSINEKLAIEPPKRDRLHLLMQKFNLSHSEAKQILTIYERRRI